MGTYRMKTPEDEAFDELAKKQGAWGGGFQAKRAAAADKLYHSTEARWCENFVEVKHPHTENEIVRFYFTQPAQSMKVEGPLHVVCQCDKCKAQPAQEPAYRCQPYSNVPNAKVSPAVDYYTAPPKRPWVGLTNDEVAKIVEDVDWYNFPMDLVRASEAKLKEKNT